jgi:hypothetical protein
LLDRNTLAPINLDGLDVQMVALAEVDPKERELAEHRGENRIARRQGIRDRGLPSSGSGARVNEYPAAVQFEDAFQIFEQAER